MRQEIQERQLLEQKLRSSEAAVRGFFEAMTDLILLIDAEGNLVQAAPTNPARFYPANFDLISQTIEQLSIGQQDQQFHGYIQQAIATQQIIHFEYSLRVEEQAFDAATGDSGTSSQNLSPI